jgi:hypothetical protein
MRSQPAQDGNAFVGLFFVDPAATGVHLGTERSCDTMRRGAHRLCKGPNEACDRPRAQALYVFEMVCT